MLFWLASFGGILILSLILGIWLANRYYDRNEEKWLRIGLFFFGLYLLTFYAVLFLNVKAESSFQLWTALIWPVSVYRNFNLFQLPVSALLVSGITGLILTDRFAGNMGRSRLGWVLLNALLPYTMLVLAFMDDIQLRSSNEKLLWLLYILNSAGLVFLIPGLWKMPLVAAGLFGLFHMFRKEFKRWREEWRKNRRQARIKRCQIKGNVAELHKMLVENKNAEDLCVALGRIGTPAAVEILIDRLRENSIYAENALRKILPEMGHNLDLKNLIESELKQKQEKDRAWTEANKLAEKAWAESERLEKKRKQHMMVCPKCQMEVTFLRVDEHHQDYDDGWFTRYWYSCKTCHTDIVDGFGQLVTRVEQN